MIRLPASLALAALLTLLPGTVVAQAVERLAEEDRAEIARQIRRGDVERALDDLDEVLEEDPGDLRSRALRARARFERCDHEGALEDAERAYAEGARGGDAAVDREGFAESARVLAGLLVELGRAPEAVRALEEAGSALRPEEDPRDAWALGSALLRAGARERAHEMLQAGAYAEAPEDWEVLLDQARCQRALGNLRRAASTLVAADGLAAEQGGAEPDVLVALGELYFDAYGEVDDAVSRAHSPAELYREALTLHPDHEGARLGLFELYRFNWMRRRTTPGELLRAVFDARPDSIRGRLAQVSAALDDGNLPEARSGLERLSELAPGRRDVRAEQAALAWVEHRRDVSNALLEALVAEDPGDSEPERIVARHLIALYRFSEALPFAERSVERDETDHRSWTELGHALANTGDEEGAREALSKSVELSGGRRDAWRDNTLLVLERMAATTVRHTAENDLSFAWMPDAARVLETYLVPFYEQAREELAARYGFTPGPVHIEVFRKWADFSVRSTGYEGFPALGVCFGPVVTAVSPLAEMRGQFSWARTSFHEFTHVVHLGLSHNRCPRWVTEGLATWEEGRRNPSWWRNMRGDLVDARANETLIPLRRLNQAFRSQRVLFAYYQSGLLCEMLVRDHGFPPMVRLLEAFDRGADLDEAFDEVFDRTPEEVDESFAAYVDEKLEGLVIEPRWSRESTFRRRFSLSRRPPADARERAEWAEDWCTVAWGFHGDRQRIDAEEALRTAGSAGPLPPRGLFLRGEMLLRGGDPDGAMEALRTGFDRGGEGYRSRMLLGELLMERGELDLAEEHLRAAERCFPGHPEPSFAAELKLAKLYGLRTDTPAAMAARQRWLAYNGGDFNTRALLARWLDNEGRHEESVRLWEEANQVDPFRRFLHYRWGRALSALGRHAEALREFDVALAVPAELDLDSSGQLTLPSFSTPPQDSAEDPPPESGIDPEDDDDEAREAAESIRGVLGWEDLEAELHGRKAHELLALGRDAEAILAAEAALALDEDSTLASEVLERARAGAPDETPAGQR